MADPLRLDTPSAEATLGIFTCAAADCSTKGRGRPVLGPDGEVVPSPPIGWGQIAAVSPEGDELVLMVCSPSCARRLAMRMTTARTGLLDG